MKKTLLCAAIGMALAVSACSEQPNTYAESESVNTSAASADVTASNPFFAPSSLQYGAPDFRVIDDAHFMPAFTAGFAEHTQEIEAIINNPEAPTFENTIVAMERSGQLLTRVSRVFSNLTGTDSNETRRQIQRELSPLMAAHSDSINLNPALFARIQAIYDQREQLDLDPESDRLLEVYYNRFVRSGATLTESQRDQIRALNAEHAQLTTQFSQNQLAITRAIAVVVDDVADLDGLSDARIRSAAQAAEAAGHEGQYLLSITNTTRQPILTSLNNRELRQRVWEASALRGTQGDYDNRPLVARLAQIRAERAQLLGYETWADYQLQNTMAQTPQNVLDMLDSMVPKVVENTLQEQAQIQEMIVREGGDFEVQPWDWEFYAEKVRQELYDLNESEVQEYFEFNRVLHDGVFYTMNRLYGITFERRDDLPAYHPDVEVYEVFDHDGSSLAIFYADYFAREGKRGGAWMSSFVGQSHLLDQKPVVVNVMNIPKAPDGEPTLITYDHVTTIFHEIGHGIHGMFSNVTYPTLAGTSVSRDFVEFPSTFEEDWAAHPEVLANYAKHYETGEPIPADLLERVMQSRTFNQGFDTLEYIAASYLDMEWHMLAADAPLQDVEAFEAQALAKHGVDLAAVPPRYKSTFFNHSIGGGYSAGYYAYMWSEILAADAFAYVQSQGGLTRENGNHYRRNILEVGNSRPPMESYIEFRGQEPTTEALLIRRGIIPRVN
ncbi:M3 family metallopeptidase [Aliidiomarina sanyensis]|uniref:Dipeptidyl carboxypeptidase II n=1 Tax=Aliidiomarina sanyensis TaxID=1249555 RepID=A0A432WPP1_9GAMM|nr:M3 family metallopeptidase [Aliidiomarina sanyensis]RUO35754.1 dipeptidyl carboxypeptidase II [Aliidiomarina sanyensis]